MSLLPRSGFVQHEVEADQATCHAVCVRKRRARTSWQLNLVLCRLETIVVTQTTVDRIVHREDLDPNNGTVTISWQKVIWLLGNFIVAVVVCIPSFALDTVMIFIGTTAYTLLFGHSLGMHRLLIHRSYSCPKWIEYLFVHLGVLVGMAGPFGMITAHDTRDWAQRQKECHPYLRHGSRFLKDGFWQLFCDLSLDRGPNLKFENRIDHDRVYRFMDRTWMLQQLPLALILFLLGGLPFVAWGICARIVVSVVGHWLVGYFAHNHGGLDHEVEGAAVQGRNVPWTAYLTMGESWHNNHHAFPGSAVLGLYENQPDPGWFALNAMHNLGLVWEIKFPQDLALRPELKAISQRAQTNPVSKTKPCPILNAAAT